VLVWWLMKTDKRGRPFRAESGFEDVSTVGTN